MAAFLENIAPFTGNGKKNDKGRIWKNFWKNMIHINIRTPV